jgi:hypothetical protein
MLILPRTVVVRVLHVFDDLVKGIPLDVFIFDLAAPIVKALGHLCIRLVAIDAQYERVASPLGAR